MTKKLAFTITSTLSFTLSITQGEWLQAQKEIQGVVEKVKADTEGAILTAHKEGKRQYEVETYHLIKNLLKEHNGDIIETSKAVSLASVRRGTSDLIRNEIKGSGISGIQVSTTVEPKSNTIQAQASDLAKALA